MKVTYGQAIREGFSYLLKNHKDVFVLGQGLWSPWYVGSSMTDLDKEFGLDRVIDTPVSEGACTSAAIGASLYGKRPIVVHPRMDFMVLASDSIVNHAAKWCHMFGGQVSPKVTFRGIINRGGEQGAQHSQSLQSWYAHIPGLRVVMPFNVSDARDLLIAAVLSNDPVVYIDDRWLYEEEGHLDQAKDCFISDFQNDVLIEGKDLTLASCSWGSKLAIDAAKALSKVGINAEVIDLKILNPFDSENLIKSVKKTGRLLSVDVSWKTCGISSEIIACVAENINPNILKSKPIRITLPDAPAPTSSVLEKDYFPTVDNIVQKSIELIKL